MHIRKCFDCGSEAAHESDVAPGVCCKSCGSQDTRKRKQRLPQRFMYRSEGTGWMFGAVFPYITGWRVMSAPHGSAIVMEDPWEALGQVLGDVEEFRWIDNDYDWPE